MVVIYRMLHLLALCMLACPLIGQDIDGFWSTVNEETKKPQAIVAIYKYKDMHYGRMIGTYQRGTGKIFDTLYHPIERAPGIVGEPYYSGLDFIYNLKQDGEHYKGRIVDPEEGNIYRAELWRDKGNLIVRGKLLFFGRNQTWIPFSQFSEEFPKPDVTKFIPKIPEVTH
jgi:uncharacterized protein (DUF2147 family)